MASQFDLNRLRVAAPCPADWDAMRGDARVRFCAQCNLHVYNLAALTPQAAQALVANTEGRLCARLYRRADGTVLTQDCPIGWRALKRRVSLAAGAVFAALLSLAPGVAAQKQPKPRKHAADATELTLKRLPALSLPADQRAPLAGTLLDPTGAAIPNVFVTVVNVATKERQTVNGDEEGRFRFAALAAGAYDLKLEAPGFRTITVAKLSLQADEAVRVEALMRPSEMEMGIIVIDNDPAERVMNIEGVKIRYED